MVDFAAELQADLHSKGWDFRCSGGQEQDVTLSVRLLRAVENYLRLPELDDAVVKERAAKAAAAAAA